MWARTIRLPKRGSDEAVATATSTTAEPGTVATPWARVSTRLSSAVVTGRMQDRLKEKRSVERRVWAIKWGKRAALATAVAAAGWVVLMSPLLEFDAEAIEASGYGSVVDPAQVDTVLAAYDGSALATLNTSHVENQLTEIIGVSAAQVEVVWPSGLRVTLTPSEPVAAIPSEDGFALVTDTGEQVSTSEEKPGDLPVVAVPVGEEHERILSGVLGVLDETPVDLRERIENVEADTEDSIHFVLRDGPRVEWGSVDDSPLKAEVLTVLLASPEAEDAEVIDVSAPSLPTVVKS
ncbi:cell division protein FtsQ/DivIB [Demequina flava]|uniref:cell division protein FtsQ/DivIB n=1 Tax=Demequina flava TaxID=1095025 RepID=UPI000784ABDE|nr:cell division protein FtsQ/DivIB [Demequina flava]